MDESFWGSLRAPIGQIAGALVVAALVGAFGGGALFERVFGVVPSSFVRESLAVSAACFFAFLLTTYRILRGEKPIDVHIPPSWNLFLSAALVILVGFLIGTTVFR